MFAARSTLPPIICVEMGPGTMASFQPFTAPASDSQLPKSGSNLGGGFLSGAVSFLAGPPWSGLGLTSRASKTASPTSVLRTSETG